MPLPVLSPDGWLSLMREALLAATSRITRASFNKSTSPSKALVYSNRAGLLFAQTQVAYQVDVTRAATSQGADLTSFYADFNLQPPRVLARPPQTSYSGGNSVIFGRYSPAPPGGALIPVGTIIQNKAVPPDTPIAYQAIADLTHPNYNAGANGYYIPYGQNTVAATAQGILAPNATSGTALNVSPGELSVIVSSGVPADYVQQPYAIANGADEETDPALRVRGSYFFSGLQFGVPPGWGGPSGNPSSIMAAVAGSYAGLTFTYNDFLDANANPIAGEFTIVADDGSGAISTSTIDIIEAAVDAVLGGGVSFDVIAPTNETMTIVLSGTSIQPGFVAATVRANVQAALIAAVNTNGVGGYNPQTGIASGKMPIQALINAVEAYTGTSTTANGGLGQGLAGYTSITLNGGSVDIALTSYQLARASTGSVTVS